MASLTGVVRCPKCGLKVLISRQEAIRIINIIQTEWPDILSPPIRDKKERERIRYRDT